MYYKYIIDIHTGRSVHYTHIIIYSVRRYTHFGFDPNFMSDTEEVCADEMVSDPFHHMYVLAAMSSPRRRPIWFFFFLWFSSLIIEI